MGRLRRFIIVVHRYLGIPMSVVFVVWFVSGVVMMYAGGLPAITPDARLARLAPIVLDRVGVSPVDAAVAAGLDGSVASLTLQTVLDRPAYRLVGDFGSETTLFADTGEIMEETSLAEAERVAAAYVGAVAGSVRFVETVAEVDQWTLAQQRDLPLHRFDVDDGAGTRVYVSPRSGEVELLTTRRDRALAWAGTIPHWFYFTPLRMNQPLWYWTVVWVSVLGCLLAVLGLVLGVTQFRRSKPFKLSASVRYRGWMRWHYWTGAVFGVFALTWVFSGLLSMEPFAWTSASGLEIPRDAYAGGSIEPDEYAALDGARIRSVLGDAVVKEIEYVRIQGDPYFVLHRAPADSQGSVERERLHQPYTVALDPRKAQVLVDATTLEPRREPFSTESLLGILRTAAPDAAIREHALLEDYDAYYYSRGGQAPLPVLRVKLDDPAETWVYIDPAMSEVVATTHRYSRIERWLFNGLHSLDFAFWYDRRPLWDIGMILLSIGALTTSLIGMCLGFMRLTRSRSVQPGRVPIESPRS